METNNEMVELFIEEMGQLKEELLPIFNELKNNVQQPKLFLDFSQVTDRIYGTAITMGFVDIGEYFGAVRNITRKCGNSKIPRAMHEVFRIVKSCMENFDELQMSLRNFEESKALRSKIAFDMKRVDRIEAEIFAFSKSTANRLK